MVWVVGIVFLTGGLNQYLLFRETGVVVITPGGRSSGEGYRGFGAVIIVTASVLVGCAILLNCCIRYYSCFKKKKKPKRSIKPED
jgi:hypothetical protein